MSKKEPVQPPTPAKTPAKTPAPIAAPTSTIATPTTTIKDRFMGMFNWVKSKMPYTKKGGRSSKRTRKNRKRGGYVIKRSSSKGTSKGK